MRALITGAGGFVGRVLVRRLLDHGLGGRPMDEVVVADLNLEGLPEDVRLTFVPGSIAEAGLLEQALARPSDVVFHLASVPGGASERDPALGRKVNLEATLRLLDLLVARRNQPRLVFASTIGVYGEACDEDTPAAPVLSYGVHKLACELLITDAACRGDVDGRSLRLPGIVARPDAGAGLISAFMSQLFWRLRAEQPIVLPVTAEGTAWRISVGACVDNLLHAAVVDGSGMGPRRVAQMPAQRLTMRACVVDALARLYGDNRRTLVRYEPQEMVQRLFASFPELATPRAEAMGFRHDGTADALVRRSTEP